MLSNVDELELNKFSQLAHKWWDKNSEFKPLHDINPLRLAFIDYYAKLTEQRVLDVGCGGGILAESMAIRGAQVTGIDLAKKSLKVAQLHSLESAVDIDYRCVSAEELAASTPGSFDIVTCMELLEHVPDPRSIVVSCARLVRPDGWVFFSTLNRNISSYLTAIIGAEYVLGILPRGTHEYSRFIKPSELAQMLHEANLSIESIKGLTYYPLSHSYALTDNTSVNYLVAARRISDHVE